MEFEYQLPISWSWKPLGDTVDFQNGYAFKSNLFRGSGNPIVRISNLQNGAIYEEDLVYFDAKDYDKGLDAYKIFPGDLLIAMSGATTGKIAINQTSKVFYLNQRVGLFRSKNETYKKYLSFYLSTKVEEHLLKSFGSAIPNLSSKQILELPIPFPPPTEQTRIVAKLDALFERIDKAIALLEGNIKRTGELMGAVLGEVFGETNAVLSDACYLNPKKSEVKDVQSETLVSFVPMADLKENQIHLIPQQKKPIGEVYKGYTYFRNGDVVLAKVTPCFENGKAGIAQGLENEIGFGSSEYHVLRPKRGVLAEWLYYIVSNQHLIEEGVKSFTGSSGLQRLPQKFLETYPIYLPNEKTQIKAIGRISSIFSKAKTLQVIQVQKLHHLQALKSSLLDRAFRGEL